VCSSSAVWQVTHDVALRLTLVRDVVVIIIQTVYSAIVMSSCFIAFLLYVHERHYMLKKLFLESKVERNEL
jgi:hypothetical protein